MTQAQILSVNLKDTRCSGNDSLTYYFLEIIVEPLLCKALEFDFFYKSPHFQLKL